MRKMFASTMLFLLMLLSVGSVRCQARCSVAMMPTHASSSNDAVVSMDDGMEQCNGMRSSMPAMDATCGMSLCQHQALPAAPDAWTESGTLQQLHLQVLPPYAAALTVPVFRPLDDLRRPPLPPRSPLDQSLSLRV